MPALFWAQSEHSWTGGRTDKPGQQPGLLGGGEALEGGAGVAGGEAAGGVRPGELKFHKWKFGRGALASAGVHCHLR